MIAANDLIGRYFTQGGRGFEYWYKPLTFYDPQEQGGKCDCEFFKLSQPDIINGYTQCWVRDLKPIPLTPEILNRIAGFEKQEDGRYYCRRFYLKMREHDLLISSESRDTITVLSCLHQLQNFFAICRQIELQIKLPVAA
jgi:hypothetical protein